MNTAALHNTHLLWRTLPRHLTKPILLFDNRKEKHHELATQLRLVKDAKRKAAKDKRDAKKLAEGDKDTAQGSGSGASKKRKTISS